MSKLGASGITPASVMRPWLGRIPKRPHRLAGMRIEPPVSLPSAKSTSLPATAAAEPEDEPPGMRPGAATLVGVP